MAINFSVGNWVIPNQTYIATLKSLTKTPLLKQSLGNLASLIGDPAQVMAIGHVSIGATTLAYMRVRPSNKHPFYKGGIGVTIYFSTDDALNNSFESSKAYLLDQQVILCLNNSGGTLAKGRVVRQTGFDTTLQIPTIALADATTEANAVVFGVLQESVANGSTAGVLVDGSFQYDTSGFSLGAAAYLSNTPGMIATTAGTVSVTVGRVLNVATAGTISFFSVLTGGASIGGGGGSGSDMILDQYSATAGQTDFILSSVPANPSALIFFVEGVGYTSPNHITVSGTSLTWLETDFVMPDGARAEAFYQVTAV